MRHDEDMKTRIGFWILGAALIYLFGVPFLRSAAEAPILHPFTRFSPQPLTTPLFVVVAIAFAFAFAGGAGASAAARVHAKDAPDHDDE